MPQGRRTDLAILAVLGIVAAAVIALLVVTGQLEDRDARKRQVRTTSGTDRAGLMAVYLLLDRLGTDVRRWAYPFEEKRLREVHVLMVMDATVPIRAVEREELRRWVRSGGVLVCTLEAGRQLEDLHGLRGSLGSHGSAGEEGEGRKIPVRQAGLPLARDVGEVVFETNEVLERPQSGTENEIRPLLVDSAGLRLACLPCGRGSVIVLAECGFLDNGRLGRADNAVLAANLAAYATSLAGGGRVAFDEYHVGLGDEEGGLGLLVTMLFDSPPGWAVLVLTTCGVMVLLWKGRRFGARRDDRRPRRRGKLEYARSVGATFRAAGAHGLAFWLLFGRFRRRCAAAASLGPGATPEQIAAAAPLGDPGEREGLRDFLRAGDRAGPDDRLSQRRFRQQVQWMSNLEKELGDGNVPGR